jgi:hypothetical protein
MTKRPRVGSKTILLRLVWVLAVCLVLGLTETVVVHFMFNKPWQPEFFFFLALCLAPAFYWSAYKSGPARIVVPHTAQDPDHLRNDLREDDRDDPHNRR